MIPASYWAVNAPAAPSEQVTEHTIRCGKSAVAATEMVMARSSLPKGPKPARMPVPTTTARVGTSGQRILCDGTPRRDEQDPECACLEAVAAGAVEVKAMMMKVMSVLLMYLRDAVSESHLPRFHSSGQARSRAGEDAHGRPL